LHAFGLHAHHASIPACALGFAPGRVGTRNRGFHGRKKTWAGQWKLHNALVLFNTAPVT